MNDREFDTTKRAIADLTGIDLDSYKVAQMKRRLDGYIGRTGMSVREFCASLYGSPDQVRTLREFITINVSEFFRDPEQFAMLRNLVLPELLRGKSRLKIWSAGCSHGGEAYSVAMSLLDLDPPGRHRILGSDLDAAILRRATAGGPYTAADVRAVGRLALARYFRKDGNRFWVTDEVRRRVDFQRHNLLADRFEGGFDLIICRNVVIYFSDDAKESLNERFYQALGPAGWLFIGGTESLLGSERLGFARVQSSLYRKVPSARAQQRAA